jgi:AmiR/NasT family two-component response regulator
VATAIGVLMGRHRLSESEAFSRLRSRSQRTHRKMAEVASEVVLGDEPDAHDSGWEYQ